MSQYTLLLFALIERSLRKLIMGVTSSIIKETRKRVTHPIITLTMLIAMNAYTAAENITVSKSGSAIPSSKKAGTDAFSKFINDFNAGRDNEDARMSIDAIIVKYGYAVEKHRVTTEDGYVVTMFRIPSNGPLVFLMHGLLGCADDFIVAGRESGLAYLLADQGYDVWLGNARGNKHSRHHTTINPSDASFWDFSWHEIGVYDLPAMIDRVLSKTNRTSLKYIGHSQGTTAFFVMASERPEYNRKISLMIALSPVAYLSKVRSPVARFIISRQLSAVRELSKGFGIYEFFPDTSILRSLRMLACGSGPLATILCSNMMFLIAGYDFEQLNVTNIPVVFGHLPSSASMKQLYHYGQIVNANDFRKFNYGYEENMRRYRMAVPPKYALDNIVVPISMIYCDADWLAHPNDVERLRRRLSKVVDVYKVPFEHFNHVDFILAKDVKILVYKRLLEVLSLY